MKDRGSRPADIFQYEKNCSKSINTFRAVARNL
jgi:hypothetical protein